jgi:hypothetical protein
MTPMSVEAQERDGGDLLGTLARVLGMSTAAPEPPAARTPAPPPLPPGHVRVDWRYSTITTRLPRSLCPLVMVMVNLSDLPAEVRQLLLELEPSLASQLNDGGMFCLGEARVLGYADAGPTETGGDGRRFHSLWREAYGPPPSVSLVDLAEAIKRGGAL